MTVRAAAIGSGSPVAFRWGRRALAMLSLLAALASVALYFQDFEARQSARRFVRAFELDRSHPEEVEAMALEPAGDLAGAMAVAAVVSKRRVPSESASNRDPRVASARVPSPKELRAARELMLDALAFRPGWARHLYLLGVVDFREARGSGNRSDRIDRWGKTLRLAAKAAPGLDAPWVALGEADLQSWDDLSPAERAEASAVFRRSFLNEGFVTTSFRDVVAAVGRSRAIRLLPNDSGALETAARILAEQEDIEGAGLLISGARNSQRRERAADLRRLEERRRLGDLTGLRLACRSWFDRHPYGEFDDRVGRAEVARLLELWPDDRLGSWTRDPRGRLVRFFLDGREGDVEGPALLRAIQSMTRVPESVQARVLLRTGDISGSQALARSVAAPDPLEWDSYFVAVARRELSKGRAAEARDAVARLSFGGREGCDALLLRRQIARSLRDAGELGFVEERLGPLRKVPGEDWADRGSLSVCVDPAANAGESLDVSIGPGSAAILAFGWNGGRSGTISLPVGETSFRVPLVGLSGQRSLWISILAGDARRSLHAALKAAS